MSPFMRSFMLTVMGFVAGIAVTMLLRREPLPPSHGVKPALEAKPVSKDAPSQEPSTAPPAPSGSAEPAKVDPTKGMKSTGRAMTPVEPEQIKFGRRERPELDSILNAASWEKFYEACKEKSLGSSEYEDLVFRRTIREMGLDAEKTDTLKRLFKAEQVAATKAIFDSSGGSAGFDKVREDLGTNRNATYEEWRRQREVVRRLHEAEYLKVVTYDQLTFFSEHLRNTQINLESTFAPEGVYHLIGGVGKMPK